MTRSSEHRANESGFGPDVDDDHGIVTSSGTEESQCITTNQARTAAANLQIDGSDEDASREEMSNIPSLVVAFCASLTTGGTTYSFGLYGATLQKTLHLTQAQVDTISTAFFFAGLFSFMPGLCSDQFGSRVALIAGGILGCLNLLLYWGVATESLVIPHALIVPALSILGICTFLSSALVTGAVFKTVTIACQGGSNKGTAVGIAKGYVGLGSGLYVAIFEALRMPGETNLDFLPMVATFCIVAVTIPGFLFMPTKKQLASSEMRDDSTALHYCLLYASLAAMAAVIVGSSFAQLLKQGNENDYSALEESFSDEPEFRKAKNHVGLAILLVAVWLLPIYSFFVLPKKKYEALPATMSSEADDGEAEPITTTSQPGKNDTSVVRRPSQTGNSNNNNNGDEDEELSLLETSDHLDSNTAELFEDDNDGDDPSHSQLEVQRRTQNDDDRGVVRDKNLLQMLRTPSALLMLWTTTILVGAGTLESNNMGQMVESLGLKEAVTPASVALFSVAQAAARVFTGALSENAIHWRSVNCCNGPGATGVPRPFFLVMASVLGFFAHVTLGVATTQNVFVFGAVLSGAAFGACWPLMVLVIGEVFGPNNIGGNYMFFDGFTSAAGTFLLSKIVAQDVYEAHVLPPNHNHEDGAIDDDALAAKDDDDDEEICLGADCFRLTHWIAAGLAVTCIASSIAMQYITRDIYRKKLLAAHKHSHNH